jgi:tRNA(Arg) A34 adenosine deaminase TadA
MPRKMDPLNTWYGDSSQLVMGSYIALEDRKVSSKSDMNMTSTTRDPSTHTDTYAIRKKIEKNVVRS